ncbi:MAG: glycosyl hydrolase [Draconibacterium sp.]|nr:glycosyl hydrolase [Draconibacterium sp.]
MKKTFIHLLLLALTGFILQGCNIEKNSTIVTDNLYEQVKTNFKSPESNSGVNCWWWWINGNVNKAAITKDLEAMKSRNFQGAMIFDAGGHNQRGNRDIPKGPLFGSDEWNDLFVFALDEAKRLGLEIGFNIQSGWNLGGPRVTPEYAAKQLTYSEIRIIGNKTIAEKLPQPGMRNDFYKDIAVIAFPIKEENKINDYITDLNLKLGFRELGGSAPDCRFLLGNIPRDGKKQSNKTTQIVAKDQVIDLTSKMDNDGNLNWEAPEGEWNILRLGYTCTSSHVSTSSGDWQGSVLDYMSKEAFDFYWNDVVEPIFAAAGDHVGTTLKYMETDSWECGGMNWTDKFANEFRTYRGYDILNYLPVAANYIVDDINTTNAFLADFRKTLGDLVAYNHYARFQKYAHKYNMGIQPESAGPHAGPMDGIKNYGFSDIVMSEFWSPSPHRPRPYNRFFLKQASSAAHIYGKKIVGAESFTTIGPHWNDELWHDQKSAFDHEICAGLNRMYFHTFTCSPPEMGLPGQEYFAGTHVNPQVTWWKQSGPFIDYMHRTQSVVQEGKFVADVLYYYGDHVPNVFPYKHSDPAGVMPGFDYDVTDETIFLKLKIKDGKIIVPGGVEYRVLVLPDHKVLSFAVLKKVEELLKQGAQIIGHKPESSNSLVGGDEKQKEFSELAEKIWGNVTSEKGENKYGKGLVAWGISASEYLLSKNVPADFDIVENDSKTDFDYIHYKLGEADVYFVSNQTTERQKITCKFRVSEKQPELWDALNGEIREAKAFTQKDGLTTVPLTLEPYGAVMVVFNNKIDNSEQGTEQQNYSDYIVLKEIKGEWKVNFDTNLGPFESTQDSNPGEFTFAELMDWTQHTHEGIKYYSGSAIYNKTFTVDFELQIEKKYFLQLGSVKDVGIAEVKINGIDKGVIWTKPFRLDITNDLKKGENKLEIKVVNSWYNRVAGDETFPDKKQYTNTNIILSHDYRGRPIEEIPLEPSGLMGPVLIQYAQ